MSKVEELIIIGSGPAGHTAAIYAGRAMLKPLMFEGYLANDLAAGGQLTTTTDVENYPGFPDGIQGPELMERMRQQSLNSDARIETKTVTKVDFSERPFKVWPQGEDEPRLAKTVIISTGAIAKRLHLPGEEEYWQKGVSACAVCDGALPIFRDKHLVVIGGGDSACEESSYLTKYAKKVTMLVRSGTMAASKIMQERVEKNDKIEIMWHTEAQKILGDGEEMTQLEIINNETDETEVIDAGGLFYAIGHKPATEFLDGQITLDDTGYIKTETHMSTVTNIPGVYAAGDVQDKVYRQAVTAAGTGCMAALEAERFLEEEK